MQKGKFNIIIGAQAGSESKGKLSAFLVEKFNIQHIVMAASPNAGHTAYDPSGRKYVSYHLPVGAATAHHDVWIYLGPTSVILPRKFLQELSDLGVDQSRIFIHPRATIITHAHMVAEREGELLKIGSTNQGVGAARGEKLMRSRDVIFAESVPDLRPMIDDTVFMVNDMLQRGVTVLCEMTQGFDLDLEHGIDPHYCTSKMINPAMAMAEAGVSPKWLGHVYGVLRPYPIRVNNREGSSGPYAEAMEIAWDAVADRCGAPGDITEITTTTKLPRRVFEFSWDRFEHFCSVCRPDFTALQFANYLNWDDYGQRIGADLSDITCAFISDLETEVEGRVEGRPPVAYVGTGAEHDHMIDMGVDEWEE